MSHSSEIAILQRKADGQLEHISALLDQRITSKTQMEICAISGISYIAKCVLAAAVRVQEATPVVLDRDAALTTESGARVVKVKIENAWSSRVASLIEDIMIDGVTISGCVDICVHPKADVEDRLLCIAKTLLERSGDALRAATSFES